MEEVDKLSCKEELELSDLDQSGGEDHKEVEEIPKKRKPRRREVDLIKLSDDEDEDDDSDDELAPKKSRHFSPGPNSPASHREPRTCVLKASQKRKPLSRLLEHLLRNLEKRDPNQFFAWPVNDNFAPNYSRIIRRPMDFSSIRQKIDDNEYRSLNCFINDFKLMCNNAMKYNKPGTVYHKAARKLLHSGLRQLTPQKLRPQGNILTYMYEIPIRELGFDIGKMDVHKVLKRSSPMKSGGSEAEAVSEGERNEPGDHVKLKMSKARDKHRQRIAKKAFPRMDRHSKTTLCVVTAAGERGRTLADLVGRLAAGTGVLHSLREDRRNLVRGVKPLQYGPWSAYAPAHDSTFATLTKDESHLLYHTLPTETGEGNESLLRFAADSPWALIYDMPAMFPDKREGTEATVEEEQQEPEVPSVDIESLRSLSQLGIETDFLTEMEEDIVNSQKDYGIGPELKKASKLLKELETLQNARLSQPPPPHLSLVGGPSVVERGAAAALCGVLARMTAALPPAAAAPAHTVRAALGVTLAHLDTPMLVDEVSEGTEETSSELDSRSTHLKVEATS